MTKTYDVAAYVWPSYTGDETRTRVFWPEGMGEWQTVRNAVKKKPDHDWPRKPLWGYVNEADPRVMEMQIDAAADHGVNVFIYDWYWYDRRPFLENCLNDGFLKARNHQRMKFYLMWANHHATALWDVRNSHMADKDSILWLGSVDRAEFEIIGRRLIEKYFKHPAYYTIDGKPVFMIFDVNTLIKGLGSIAATRDAFTWFRAEAVKSGLPGLHLQLCYWNDGSLRHLSAEGAKPITGGELVQQVGFDSLTNYQFCMFTNIDRDYPAIVQDVVKVWERIDRDIPAPYFPHVSVGWDNNPRFKEFRPGIVTNNTPENVRLAFVQAKAYVDAHPNQPPLITVNSWNEWTETSYLQPDDLYGYGYLQAIKSVFGGGQR
ncbi:MAG: glycoside hydrolase family 99-like domain-containing protein [Planctomycetota bacterium]